MLCQKVTLSCLFDTRCTLVLTRYAYLFRIAYSQYGGVAKLVIAPACQAGGRGFNPRRSRSISAIVTGCSAVASALGSGPRGRRFKSAQPDTPHTPHSQESRQIIRGFKSDSRCALALLGAVNTLLYRIIVVGYWVLISHGQVKRAWYGHHHWCSRAHAHRYINEVYYNYSNRNNANIFERTIRLCIV